MKYTYKTTIFACFVGYVVQATINNFIPLLFITFQESYGIPLGQITLLVTINFAVQLLTDFAAANYVDRIGYRTSILIAHIACAAGLLLLMVLPDILPPFIGLLICVFIYAVGGGIIEVLVSPIMESCPTDNKAKAMSLLHSFYCWGHVSVVLLSTLFFRFVGIQHWRILAACWALIPIANIFLFAKTPIAPLVPEDQQGMTTGALFRSKTFWIFMVIMLCSGASEHSVAQWASAFTETALGISKTLGDLVGPMTFAVLMGISRVFYGKYGDKIDLSRFMKISTTLCVTAYLIAGLARSPVISLVGCGLCGLSVGIMWPGAFSRASVVIKNGGTAMFALFALAGDLGCSLGPTLVGSVSSMAGDNLKTGLLAAVIFPLLLLVCLNVPVHQERN